MLETEILENLKQLPDPLQQEVLHYIEFLKARYTAPAPQPTQPKKRQAGRLKGKIVLAEDFDAPLEDLKEYM
ncbi:type II toxin-antitoxin system VapB family antitoxin [Leptolyngbya sp. AN03gr2]|uniref:type II toxin-antitoxin system VapB family antitoxin n=1 Tax=unclassified Leptolyngbya TaxID=2650499 RepID=UPI003D316B53